MPGLYLLRKIRATLCGLLVVPVLVAQTPNSGDKVDAAERQIVLHAVISDVKQFYFDRGIAQKTADALLAHGQAGDYDQISDAQAFANLLVRHLIDASGDAHFTVEFTRNAFPDFSKPPPSETQTRIRAAMEQNNCTFEKIELWPDKIGYVKLNSFPDIAVCQAKAKSAMAALNGADAIIFDLRDNRGGDGAMGVFLAGYLFDHPEYMFSPRGPVTEQAWTRSPVSGSLLVDKPVYILTSERTYSAAEQFSYDLKVLKRATLVGETTGGASHAGVLHNLDPHFAIGIPELRPVNPFSDKDWAISGVEPDVKVKAVDALAAARKLAGQKIQAIKATR